MELVVGRVAKAHGITGEVVVDIRTDDPEVRFAPGNTLRAKASRGAPDGSYTVESARTHGNRLLVRLAGVADRNAAEALRGTLFVVDSADLPPPEDPEEFYDHQLVGLAVVDLDGQPIGEVTGVAHGAQDLLEIRATDGRETLVPFVAALVPEVDVPAGRVVIADRPGLVTAFPEDDGS